MSTDQGVAPGSSAAADEERSKRKRRAFLAVGLVVGLGVGATLAVFSTNVFGSATFATGDYGIEVSFDKDGALTDPLTVTTPGWLGPTAGASDISGAFAFPMPLPNIAPEVPVFAPIWVRPTETSEYASDFKYLSVTNAGGSAGSQALFDTLEVAISQSATCTSDADFGTAEAGWPNGVPFPATTPSSTLPVPLPGGDTATPLKLCLRVMLPQAADTPETRGQEVDVVFNFNAVAVIPTD